VAERQFKRDVQSLDTIFDFVADFLAANGIPPSNSFNANLLIEELFTNMVKYSKGSTGDVTIGLSRDGPTLVIRLVDHGVDAFDVAAAREVDLNQPIRERRSGGLGLHFVRRVADRVEYEYKDRTSTITVTKRLEP